MTCLVVQVLVLPCVNGPRRNVNIIVTMRIISLRVSRTNCIQECDTDLCPPCQDLCPGTASLARQVECRKTIREYCLE